MDIKSSLRLCLLCTALILFAGISGPACAATSIPFTVTMSESVNVTGTPRIVLDVDGTTRYATYASGSGTATLTFTYNATSGDLDLNGIGIASTSVDVNGGTITDLNGNALTNLTFVAPNTSAVKIDYPSIAMDFTTDADGRFSLGGIVYNDVTSFLSAAGGSFSRASTATYFNSTGTLQTAATNTPRLDYNPATLAARGLLIEESSTNYTKNSGFSSLTGGTYTTDQSFTNWFLDFPSGVTSQSATITSGSANGIPYLDIRLQATNSAASTQYITFNPSVAADSMAVVNGDISVVSAWFGISSYSSTGGTCGVNLSNRSMTSATGYITSTDLSFTATNTYQQRVTSSLTHGATAAYAALWTFISIPVGVTCDITYRLGAPQIEKIATATSYIPTPANATASRSADNFTIPTGAWFNSAAGMLYGQSLNGTKSATVGVVAFDQTGSTGTERITLIRTSATAIEAQVRNTAGVQFFFGMAANGNNAVNKSAMAFTLNNMRSSNNGSLAALDTTAVMPTINELRLGTWGGNSSSVIYDGWIQKVKYYPVRGSDTQLQLLTQ
ncbi:MAG: hypothetical protein WC043_05570 [Pseudobdellovibrionaceae bacterium]